MRPVLFARHRVPPRLLRIRTSTSASSPSLTTKTTVASTALPLSPTVYTSSALSRFHQLRLQSTSTFPQQQTFASRHSLPAFTCSVHQLPFHASITRTRRDTSTATHCNSTATRAFSQTTGNSSSYGDASSYSANMNGTSPAARSKRKEPPQYSDGRLAKHHRTNADIDMSSADGNTPITEDFDGSYEADPRHVLPLAPGADTAEWQATIENVVRNVVSIRFCQTCSFDTDPALTSEATGFVVDAERGYILTNRHVVGSGPFWGYCIFDNHEEVDAYPVYRDPVHDFGILKFDPKAIKYMPVAALQLRPDLARVGIEIRVVGNDAGEKLSILSGVISRLDRNAPEYGDGYSDFNTCYYQASAAASGGSSGSPVVNKDGFAVALQAGGRADGASTDYFLPLDRPLRALKCLQEGKPITRGDIQCQFVLKPFDECRRLGLTPEWEAQVRKAFPKETNMLVAEIILPEGPSHKKLEEGDVLIKVNGKLLTQFIPLEETLDSSVGQTVKLMLLRGGDEVEVDIEVGDLHQITPDRFVSVSGGSFHNLSYQQARLYGVACKGVYVCEAGGSFRFDNNENGWIIQSIDQKETPDLDTFIEVMKGIPDKARVVITYKHLRDMHTLHTTVIYIDRHWAKKMKLAVRNDKTGLWDFSDLGDALPAVAPETRKASFIQLENTSHPAVADLVKSFVHVSVTMPVKLDGFPKNRKWGMGLVIDAEKGLVIISRAIVPYDLCDITITIADSIVVEGKVVFLHPLQNYAVIQYDPKLVDAPVRSAKLSSEMISQGASTYFIGYNRIGRIVHTATTVTEMFAVTIPANSGAPRYRAVNVDAITVDTNLSGQCGSGVLVAQDGTVQALWLTYLGERNPSSHRDEEYHLGLATPTLLPVISQLQQGITPKLRLLSCEFRAIQMSQARIMGVSEEWIQKVTLANTAHHQLFLVTKRTYERNEPEGDTLKEGDILLTLNNHLITKISELDIMYSHDHLDAVLVRNTKELHIKLPTVAADDAETDHAISFCGAILHRPHLAVRQQISKLFSEVYVSARTRGSPAYQYGLAPTNFVTHVNGKRTPDLQTFLAAVVDIPDNTYFRLKCMTFDSVPWVVTMKKNEHYFPTTELIKDPSEPLTGWRRITYEGGKKIEGEGHDGVGVAALGEDGGESGMDVDGCC
ncbi:trypsin-like cysteine/serine peptidase domain-containing protein [Pseudoneurospora amorphoporcata]|uniref:Pro-apoptotic serine protease NMA111 n=1 Tax=Pseudoneurospora amorphoporcata TaxID=241081 RepID=A0AAN6P1V6_9PEZI|nr:trypsin-like cysteine/serine peptidase domain-containing protein [Pseudoneurospora amorphoporcata]